LQAARRATRPRRFVTRWCFLSLRSKPLESVITLEFLIRLLHAYTTRESTSTELNSSATRLTV
jgi:hypothetical protein